MINNIKLVPTTLDDRKLIYNWFAKSDLTKEMMGPPIYHDHPIPSLEEFVDDYKPYFFDGTRPLKGRSYIIEYEGKKVGQINYQACEHIQRAAELDIWLASSNYTNKGIGTKAIQHLCDKLFLMQFKLIIIAPSKRNLRAINSYKKAGFIESVTVQSENPDYEDALTLVKKRPNNYKSYLKELKSNLKECTISTDKSRMDVIAIHDFLSKHSTWSKNIPISKVQRSIQNSLNFGLFLDDIQIGYARVITDYSTIAYLGDFYILEGYRGYGYANKLMEKIMAYPDLQGLRRWILLTSTADWLYKKYGFTKLSNPDLFMELYNTHIYT